jgi:hypothetical protein
MSNIASPHVGALASTLQKLAGEQPTAETKSIGKLSHSTLHYFLQVTLASDHFLDMNHTLLDVNAAESLGWISKPEYAKRSWERELAEQTKKYLESMNMAPRDISTYSNAINDAMKKGIVPESGTMKACFVQHIQLRGMTSPETFIYIFAPYDPAKFSFPSIEPLDVPVLHSYAGNTSKTAHGRMSSSAVPPDAKELFPKKAELFIHELAWWWSYRRTIPPVGDVNAPALALYHTSHRLAGVLGGERDFNPAHLTKELPWLNKFTRNACVAGRAKALGIQLSGGFSNELVTRLEPQPDEAPLETMAEESLPDEFRASQMDLTESQSSRKTEALQLCKDFCKLIHGGETGKGDCIFWRSE